MLAQEYVLEHPDRVNKLVLANTLDDTQSAYKSMRGFVDELPEEMRETIEAHEAREPPRGQAPRHSACRTQNKTWTGLADRLKIK